MPNLLQQRLAERKQEAPSKEDNACCPYCNSVIPTGAEYCPYCGKRLVPYCTFCGAEMSPEDIECPECGASSHGIQCPTCGKLSFRPFCPECNTPLTRAAIRAVAKAKEDPAFQKVQELVNLAEELSAEILESEKCDNQVPEVNSKETDYPIVTQEPIQNSQSIQEKKEKLANLETDINKLFEMMLPPVGSTPQEQRTFFSARKVEIKTSKQVQVTVKDAHSSRIGWVCNLCGCQHRQPNECARPELGGRWIYRTTYTSHQEMRTIETMTKVTIKD